MTAIATLAARLKRPTTDEIIAALLTDLRFVIAEQGLGIRNQHRDDPDFKTDQTRDVVAHIARRFAVEANKGVDLRGVMQVAHDMVRIENACGWGVTEAAADEIYATVEAMTDICKGLTDLAEQADEDDEDYDDAA